MRSVLLNARNAGLVAHRGTVVAEAADGLALIDRDTYEAVVAILTDPALSRIAQSDITELVVTNTIPLAPSKKHPKIKVLSIAPILAETILRIYNDWSVSQLFDTKH